MECQPGWQCSYTIVSCWSKCTVVTAASCSYFEKACNLRGDYTSLGKAQHLLYNIYVCWIPWLQYIGYYLVVLLPTA
jgi:hypothetical protein